MVKVDIMDDELPMSHVTALWLEVFILLGAIFLVVLALFIWAMFIRKTKKRRRKYHQHRGTYGDKLKKGAGEIKELVDRHSERRRRVRYHRNPTLAETGGLPPRRDADDQTSSDAT
ncbi:MAG TPA: hypothetical protein VGI03_02010 [Verrucomicrobiae bacterium]